MCYVRTITKLKNRKVELLKVEDHLYFKNVHDHMPSLAYSLSLSLIVISLYLNNENNGVLRYPA